MRSSMSVLPADLWIGKEICSIGDHQALRCRPKRASGRKCSALWLPGSARVCETTSRMQGKIQTLEELPVVLCPITAGKELEQAETSNRSSVGRSILVPKACGWMRKHFEAAQSSTARSTIHQWRPNTKESGELDTPRAHYHKWNSRHKSEVLDIPRARYYKWWQLRKWGAGHTEGSLPQVK